MTRPAAIAIGFVFCFAASNVALRAGTSDSQSSIEQIQRWIGQLDSDDYAARERATRALMAAGDAVIDPISNAAAGDSPEMAWRAGQILQRIGISGDEKTVAKVIVAMDKLAKSGHRSFEQSGGELVERWRHFRHDRAVSEIRRLGGEVIDMPAGIFLGDVGGFAPPMVGPAIIDIDGRDLMVRPLIVEPREEAIDRIILEKLKEAQLEPPADKPIEIDKFGRPAEPAPADADGPPVEDDAKAKDDVKELEKLRDGLIEFENGLKSDDCGEELPDEPAANVEPAEAAPATPAAILDIVEPEEEEAVLEIVEQEEKIGIDDEAEAPLLIDAIDFGVPEREGVILGGGFDGPAIIWDGAVTSQINRLIRLDKNWKGGVEGLRLLQDVENLSQLEMTEFDLSGEVLKQLGQLPGLQRLTLNDCSFDRDQVARLKQAKPNLMIYAVGKVLLGISGQPHPDGFQITNVVAATGAANAGLQIGDVIQTADNLPLQSLDELTLVVAQKNVGDKIKVVYQRDGKTITTEATLGKRDPALR